VYVGQKRNKNNADEKNRNEISSPRNRDEDIEWGKARLTLRCYKKEKKVSVQRHDHRGGEKEQSRDKKRKRNINEIRKKGTADTGMTERDG
jgi:hypothetical protein